MYLRTTRRSSQSIVRSCLSDGDLGVNNFFVIFFLGIFCVLKIDNDDIGSDVGPCGHSFLRI